MLFLADSTGMKNLIFADASPFVQAEEGGR
jgi:hypothetical protein